MRFALVVMRNDCLRFVPKGTVMQRRWVKSRYLVDELDAAVPEVHDVHLVLLPINEKPSQTRLRRQHLQLVSIDYQTYINYVLNH